MHPAVGQFILDNAKSDLRPGGLHAAEEVLKKASEQALWPKGYALRVKNGYLAVPCCPKESQELVGIGTMVGSDGAAAWA